VQEREALQQAWQQRQKEAEQLYKGMQGQLQAKVIDVFIHASCTFR